MKGVCVYVVVFVFRSEGVICVCAWMCENVWVCETVTLDE